MALETDIAEGAHQLRVGLTRLRAAHRALEPLLDTPAFHQLEDDARAIARAVGELRDADVLIEDIYAPVAGAVPDQQGFDALLARAPGSPRGQAGLGASEPSKRAVVAAALELGPLAGHARNRRVPAAAVHRRLREGRPCKGAGRRWPNAAAPSIVLTLTRSIRCAAP